MTKNIRKKLLSVVLILTMTVSLMPGMTLTAAAANTEPDSAIINVQNRAEVFFIDTGIPDYLILADGLRHRGEIVLFNQGIGQITEALSSRSCIDAIHILSHGAAGKVLFGNDEISTDTVKEYKKDLMLIGRSLNEDGDILLYGCETAKNKEGKTLIRFLSQATSADVAASDDLTGSASFGGDWDLEYCSGKINTEPVRIAEEEHAWRGVLSPPDTQVLNSSWQTDATNGFSEPTASVSSTNIKYEVDSIWLNSTSTNGEWIEFNADPAEGLAAFDLTSVTLGKYQDPSISFDFTITGTKASDGSTVSQNFSWAADDGLTKLFTGSDFSALTQITKFRITLQNVSTYTYSIEFREFIIANQSGSGNTPPVISGFSDVTYLENDINANFLQIDSDVAVADAESADFDGGQITVSYSGTPLTEDQLSVGDIGNISLSGSTVNYAGTDQIGTASGGANGADLVIALNANATPARTTELLRAITYKNTSDEPTSQRTVSISVSDGDGGTSAPATATISVSGQAESGVEYPSASQDVSLAWIDNLNNGFSVQGNGGITLDGDGTSIWINSTNATASFNIAAAEQFSGGMFDLSGLTFDIYNTSYTYTVTIIGHKSDGSTVSANITGNTGAALASIDLSSITEVVSFDFQVTAPDAGKVSNVGLDSFTISNPQPAGSINTVPVISGLSDATYPENDVNAKYLQINSDISVSDDDSADFDGGQITVSYSGTPLTEDQLSVGDIGNISLSGSTVNYAGTGQIGTASGGANGADLVIALNANATPARTTELLRAITYKNTSDEPTSHRTVSIAVSDGDGGISAPATAAISVSGQAESGVDYPSSTQDINLAWIDDLNNGFTVQGNGGVSLDGDEISIWIKDSPAATASFHISAAEQFSGGMFDLSAMTFDVLGSGNTYTVTIIGHKTDGNTVTASITGNSAAALTAIDLSSITEIVAFDFQITAPTSGLVDSVGLNSFTISNPGTANLLPTVTGLPASITVVEDTASNVDLSTAAFSDADGDTLTVTLAASAGTFTANSGGSVTVGGSGSGTLTLSGTAADINTFLDTAANLKYTGASNANGSPAANISINADDGTANSALGTVSINITAVNDNPSMTGLPTDVTVLENTASNVDLSAATFSDVDSGSNNVTLTLSVNSGTITAFSGGGVTASGSGTAALTLTGTAANIDTYLNTASNIKYTGPTSMSGDNADGLTLTANDEGNTGTEGGTDVILGTVNIDIAEAPTAVTNVTSMKTDNTYGIGEVIEIDITFSKPVTVTGTPQLTLETGAVDRTASYSSGSGSNTLTFTYTTQAGDESADLDYVNTNALALNGGTIKAAGGTNAVLTMPAPGTTGSLGANKAIVVQAFPTVSLSVGSANISENGGTSTITATLSEASSQEVVVTLSYSGTAASGTDYNGTASTTVTIPAGDLSANAATGITSIQDTDPEGDETIIIEISGVSKSVENGVQQQTITIMDDDMPKVVSVSSSTANGSYKAGDVISVTVMFNAAVTVTGTPQLTLETGATDRIINYASGSGTNTLTFNYTVQSGDASGDLDYKSTGSITLGESTIRSGGGLDAALALPAPGSPESLGSNKSIVIDTTAPPAPSVPDLSSGSDTGISAIDSITSDITPTFTGTAESNSTVKLYASASQVGSTTADGSGNWAITSMPLSSGTYTISATATDDAGNTGTASAGLFMTIDATAPTASIAIGDTAMKSGEICEVRFTFSEAVTGFTNSDLTIDNGTLTPVSSTDGGITYTATFTSDNINDNTNTLVLNLAGIADMAGNAGSGTVVSENYTIFIPTAPDAPTEVSATAGNGQAAVSFTAPASDGGEPIISYTVTASPGGITATGGTSPITVTGLTNGTAYTFTVTAANSVGTGSASAPSDSVTPQAPSTGGGRSSGTASQTYKADVKDGDGSGSTLPVTVERNSGSASVDASSQSNLISEGSRAVITVPTIPNVNTYSFSIPVPDLSTASMNGILTVDTGKGSITVPSDMLTGAEGSEGSRAQIAIGEGDKSVLSDELKNMIGDRPLIRLTLTIDGKRTGWNNPNAPVTVSIPYTPTATELLNPESIVVWYLDGTGNAVPIPNGRFDATTGTVIFRTTHFSDYAVAFNKESFNDVSDSAWYSDAVHFIAAREITSGTGGGKFSPKAKLTRGQFIVMLMKSYGIEPDRNPADNFSDAGSTYYTGYLAAAKRMGLTAGTGNNRFEPGREIARQEMFTLLYKALNIIGQLPPGDSGKDLSIFSDAGQVSSWAKDAMTHLVKTGAIGGSAGKLSPRNTTTRGEMAQVLFNMLGE